VSPFEEFAGRKRHEAVSARIHPLTTVGTGDAADLAAIGNDWTRRLYDGAFHLPEPGGDRLPAVSLVFVRSRDGDTAGDPTELGGGATDKHLIYEGLTRAAADAVMAGATTAAGEDVFFSVWHPEIVSLRRQLGLARHPAQIVVTGTGSIDVEQARVLNAPGVPVFVLATAPARERLGFSLHERPWVRVVALDGDRLAPALETLRALYGIRRISAVGGRLTATALLDEGLVQDVCLTTTERRAGQPGTPFYAGRQALALRRIVTKRSTDPAAPFLFEHLALAPPSRHRLRQLCDVE
jgi:riboflavin biosynthesis pyrimidine reductase